MKSRFIWRAIFALVFIGILTLGGISLYRIGFADGAMTTITIPEGSESLMMPYAHRPLGWHYGPRVGLLGLFPLLCFGFFFFLMLMCGFGFMARRRACKHYGPGSYPEHWKHHGPWGPGHPSWEQAQPETETESPPAEADPTDALAGCENNNVELAGEIVGTIISQNAYNANLKMVETQDQMIGTVLDIRN